MPPTTLKPSAFSAADPEFAAAFAVFLRQNPYLWRIRRIDRFRPRDLYLADHEVSLQGRIDPSLVHRFLESDGADLNIQNHDLYSVDARSGDELTIYLPVTSQPKRLLLEHSIEDTNENRLPMLNRYEDSWVEALNLLSIAQANGATLSRDESFPLLLALATLVFINPEALEKRVENWMRMNGPNTSEEFGPSLPLTGTALARWIEDQAEFFLPGLGGKLRAAIEPVLPDLLDTRLHIAPASRRSELDSFGSVPSLLLHAIRDFLKLLYDAAPEWHQHEHQQNLLAPSEDDGEDTAVETGPHAERPRLRSELLANPEALATDVADLLVDGIVLLNDRFADPSSNAAVALLRVLDSWWAYVHIEIRLGTPFLVKSSEILPLRTPDLEWPKRWPLRIPPLRWAARKAEEWFRTFMKTAQYYPVSLKNAQSVHVEVEVPHPELRMPKIGKPNGLRVVVPVPDAIVGEQGFSKDEVIASFDTLFGGVAEPSDRLFHVYSSRQLHEAPKVDFLLPHIQIHVPLRFRWSVFFGYSALIFAYVVAAAFIVAALGDAVLNNHPPSQLTALVTAGALAASLSLWMTSASGAEPIVNQKLVAARHILELSVAAIVCMFAIFGVHLLIDNEPTRPPERYQCADTATGVSSQGRILEGGCTTMPVGTDWRVRRA